jgi:hypothetical protein
MQASFPGIEKRGIFPFVMFQFFEKLKRCGTKLTSMG